MDSMHHWKTIYSMVLIFLSGFGIVVGQSAGDAGTTQEAISGVVDANNQFCFELYANLKNEEKGNIFFSPYSISTALGMVYEGARGQTAEEIRAVFYFPADENIRKAAFAAGYDRINKKDAKYKLSTANALWIQKDFKLLDAYTNTIEKYYSGKATNVDFKGAAEQARKKINKWVEDRTNNKIKDLFPPNSLSPETRLVLTNAIYFKGTWIKQFDKKETQEMDFETGKGETVEVPMMRRTGKDASFGYAETEYMQLLEMDYEGGELSMLILLPKNIDLEKLEEWLTVENLDEWKNSLCEQSVDVFMPRFTFTSKYVLNENLKNLGMPTAFSDGSDLSGIDGTRSLSIQLVVHQAFVDVNEEGTEAAAATGVAVGITSVAPPVPIFIADHPFVYMILEKSTGNIMFFGRVSDPRK